jgi:membrane-bound lytic murein transglycosylase D
MLLLANLTYVSNYNKELALLESFDIEPSFLYDPVMNNMRLKNNTDIKNRQFFKTMEKAYLFIPAIKNILTKYEIPQEFLYLAMAESNFSTRAYSKKRASGLWQFMPRTGKHYKLHIDEYVDERRDLIKSTEAAATYLSALHKRFGKWYLAAIAYNCGGGRLNSAIKKAGTDDLKVLLDSKKKYIPRESRFYIRKIVALALIGTDEQFLLSSEYGYLLNRDRLTLKLMMFIFHILNFQTLSKNIMLLLYKTSIKYISLRVEITFHILVKNMVFRIK